MRVHYAFCERAFRHGKAVLCEKSLTTRWDEARLLFAAARKSGRLFMEGFAYFHHPLIASLQTVLREGRLGKLKYMQASYSADIVKFANPAGGGTIFNLGCYPVSLLQLVIQTVFGPDVFTRGDISGTGFNADGGPVTDASLTIRYDQGLLASIHSSDTYGLRSDLSIHGEMGTIVFKTNPWLPEAGISRMELQHHDGRVEVIEVRSDLDGFGHQIHNAEDSFKASRPAPLAPARSIQDSP